MTLGFERARFYLATLVDEYGLATLLERLKRKTNEQHYNHTKDKSKNTCRTGFGSK